jgi:hypothetical protein
LSNPVLPGDKISTQPVQALLQFPGGNRSNQLIHLFAALEKKKSGHSANLKLSSTHLMTAGIKFTD